MGGYLGIMYYSLNSFQGFYGGLFRDYVLWSKLLKGAIGVVVDHILAPKI